MHCLIQKVQRAISVLIKISKIVHAQHVVDQRNQNSFYTGREKAFDHRNKTLQMLAQWGVGQKCLSQTHLDKSFQSWAVRSFNPEGLLRKCPFISL